MITNLVHGSYTHITVIPPVRSSTDTNPPTSVSEPLPDDLAKEPDNVAPLGVDSPATRSDIYLDSNQEHKMTGKSNSARLLFK